MKVKRIIDLIQVDLIQFDPHSTVCSICNESHFCMVDCAQCESWNCWDCYKEHTFNHGIRSTAQVIDERKNLDIWEELEKL